MKQNLTNDYIKEQKTGDNMMLILGIFGTLVTIASLVWPHIPH